MKTEAIINAAQAIRAHLPELLGAQAPAVDAELVALLDKAEAGEDVQIQILDLLGEHDPTRVWLGKTLDMHDNMRTGRGQDTSMDCILPGDSAPSPPDRNCALPGDPITDAR